MNKERCYRQINLLNLSNNVHEIKQILSPHTSYMAVVKANAYGHGSVEVSLHLEKEGISYFAVASYDEARALRKGGVKGDILIFGRTNREYFSKLEKYNLIQTISSVEYAKEIDDSNYRIRCHLVIDTGMTRFGQYMHHEYDIHKTVEEIKEVCKYKHLSVEGIYTHFSDADNLDSDFTEKQFYLFMKLIEQLEKEKIYISIKHVCNSSATLRYKEMHLDMVRIGIAMYGYPQIQTSLKLLPVLSLYAKVVDIHEVKKDDTVSYGRKFTVSSAKKIATLAIGYADGYSRSSTNIDYFVYKGKRLSQVGKVCMDLVMIDITDTDILIGDTIEIFGEKKTASVVAKHTNTIEYEVLTSLSSRVPFFYIR